jgi:hypothetical protein
MSASPFPAGAGVLGRIAHADADRGPLALWELCRNSLGIARLLVHEGRPNALVRTACRITVETACRAGLAQAGVRFDGDVEEALRLLAVPHEEWCAGAEALPRAQLAAAERVVGAVAEFLRGEAPAHSWGF